MWQDISTAPEDRDIQLAVIDREGQHILAFPCRRSGACWHNAESGHTVDVDPTHWRHWDD